MPSKEYNAASIPDAFHTIISCKLTLIYAYKLKAK